MTLTPNTTNIAEPYELPASTPVDGWQYERIDSVTVDPNVSKLYASGNYDYGTYYNWYTATAGYASSAPNYTSQYSICPKGWHLPTERQWYDLTVPYSGEEGDMSSDIATAEPISMVYAGAVYAGAYYNAYTPYMDWQDDVGYYWSATAPGNLGPLSFDVYDNDNTTGYEHNHALTIQHTYRGDGYSIRCVAL
jgi:uncharacterized protein (TIGR02145 family)